MFDRTQLERYSRQFVLKEIGVEGQKKLLNASVLVIGAGALGSPSLIYLAAAGVGTIGIADFDKVEYSNLQRQVIHSGATIGIEKAESAKRTINMLNSDVRVVTYNTIVSSDNIEELIADYDFIIDATDNLETKILINDACVMNGKPFVHAGAARFGGQIMSWIPGEGACMRCVMGEEIRHSTENMCAQYGVLGAATGVLGSVEALEAIKYITGTGSLLTGRMLFFNGLTMEFETEKIEKHPDCPLCSGHPRITSLKQRSADYEQHRC